MMIEPKPHPAATNKVYMEDFFMVLHTLEELLSACTELEEGIESELSEDDAMNLVTTDTERNRAKHMLGLFDRGERQPTSYLQVEEDWNVWECTACDDALTWSSDDLPPKNEVLFCPFCGAMIYNWVMYKDRFREGFTSGQRPDVDE